jgi:hypothetical protein
MAGLKIRTMESPVYMTMVNALGATAVPISGAEAVMALRQGVVDGQENPPAVVFMSLVDGGWEAPTGVGFGVEINEQAASRHPFEQEIVPALDAALSDGTIADWSGAAGRARRVHGRGQDGCRHGDRPVEADDVRRRRPPPPT